MSFMFTPGCCCSTECQSCQSLIQSGAELQRVPMGEISTVLGQLKLQTGRSCQYGRINLYSVDQDGCIYGGHDNVASMVMAIQGTTYFDDQTGRTKLDSNGNIVFSPSPLTEFIGKRTAMGHTVYAAWEQCKYPDNYDSFRIGCVPSVLIEHFDEFEPASITDSTEEHSIDRLEGESAADWYDRAKLAYGTRTRVHFAVTARARIVLTFTPGHRDVNGRIIKRCIRTGLHVGFRFGDKETFGNDLDYEGRWVLTDPAPNDGENYQHIVGFGCEEGRTVSVEGIYKFNGSGWIGTSHQGRSYNDVLAVYDKFTTLAVNVLNSGEYHIYTFEGILHD